MTDVVQLVEGMTEADKQVALAVLDAVSRPLKVRELEGLLRRCGLTRSQALKVASTLRRVNIIAVVGPDRPDEDGEGGRGGKGTPRPAATTSHRDQTFHAHHPGSIRARRSHQ